MVKAIVSATEIKNNFGKYMDMIVDGYEVIVTKNGKEIGRFISKNMTVSFLTDALTGVIENEYDLKSLKDEELSKKYEMSY